MFGLLIQIFLPLQKEQKCDALAHTVQIVAAELPLGTENQRLKNSVRDVICTLFLRLFLSGSFVFSYLNNIKVLIQTRQH